MGRGVNPYGGRLLGVTGRSPTLIATDVCSARAAREQHPGAGTRTGSDDVTRPCTCIDSCWVETEWTDAPLRRWAARTSASVMLVHGVLVLRDKKEEARVSAGAEIAI